MDCDFLMYILECFLMYFFVLVSPTREDEVSVHSNQEQYSRDICLGPKTLFKIHVVQAVPGPAGPLAGQHGL